MKPSDMSNVDRIAIEMGHAGRNAILYVDEDRNSDRPFTQPMTRLDRPKHRAHQALRIIRKSHNPKLYHPRHRREAAQFDSSITPPLAYISPRLVRTCDAQSATPRRLKKPHLSPKNPDFPRFFITGAHHHPYR